MKKFVSIAAAVLASSTLLGVTSAMAAAPLACASASVSADVNGQGTSQSAEQCTPV